MSDREVLFKRTIAKLCHVKFLIFMCRTNMHDMGLDLAPHEGWHRMPMGLGNPILENFRVRAFSFLL
jgi:hypothetical protein